MVEDEADFTSIGVRSSCGESDDEGPMNAEGICNLDWEAGIGEGWYWSCIRIRARAGENSGGGGVDVLILFFKSVSSRAIPHGGRGVRSPSPFACPGIDSKGIPAEAPAACSSRLLSASKSSTVLVADSDAEKPRSDSSEASSSLSPS